MLSVGREKSSGDVMIGIGMLNSVTSSHIQMINLERLKKHIFLQIIMGHIRT